MNNSEKTSRPQKKFKKSLIIGTLVIIVALVLVIIFYYFNPNLNKIKKFSQEQELTEQYLQSQILEHQKDQYGGKTPEETYQLFLEALKKEDIDLATKYFILEKQDEYKKLFQEIKNSGNWQMMMADLLKPENQKGEYLNENWYIIRVTNDKGELVANISIEIPKGPDLEPVSSLWKIAEF